jgi:hypothetical protein
MTEGDRFRPQGEQGMFNLAMALFWLVAGFAIIFWQRTHPESAALNIEGTRVSLGWPVFALVLFNLVRWYRIRAASRRQSAQSREEQRRPAPRRAPDAPEPRADQSFDFTDPKSDG